MEIVLIFAHQLYAFRYAGQTADELERLFDIWTDAGYLEQFFENNLSDLQNGYYGNITVAQAVKRTIYHARCLETDLRRLAKNDPESANNTLEDLFTPLDNREFGTIVLSKQKAYGVNYNSWLRLYALKIDPGVYIITGGAIKLTPTMNERAHTQKELEKLEKCRTYLAAQGLIDNEGFKEEFN